MREKSLLRKEDEKQAKEVSDFLDETFYLEETTKFIRCDEPELQVQGIDTLFQIDGYGPICRCDEKAAVQYRNLQTFAIELSYIDKTNEVHDGWFLDPTHINNTFLFVWIDNDKVEIALVEKLAILEYLESIGWTREYLREKAKRIRHAFDNFSTEYLGDFDKDGCKFYYSRQLIEKPINILLKRDVYKQIAMFTKIYKTDKFKKND